mgnify:CR=1 FL=1
MILIKIQEKNNKNEIKHTTNTVVRINPANLNNYQQINKKTK